MGISIEQYRGRIGSFAAKKFKTKEVLDEQVLDPPDIDAYPPTTISISWKTASLGLLLILLCALCQSQLLLMGGVEPNPGPTADETLNKRASVIAELVVKADSKTVKEVLRIYKPEMHYDQLKRAFDGPMRKSLIETMDFLGVPGCDGFVKPTIVSKLISRIQSHFPDECGTCSQEFVVSLGETVLLSCSICGQGIHNRCLAMKLGVAEVDLEQMTHDDVQKSLNPKSLQTLVYLCGYCHNSTIPSPDQGRKSKKKDNVKSKKNPKAAAGPAVKTPAIVKIGDNWTDIDSDTGTGTQPPISHSDEDSRESNDADSESESDSDKPHSRRKSPLRRRSTHKELKGEDGASNNKKKDAHPEAKTEDSSSKRDKPVCPFYRQGQCRHGISGKGCSKAHPQLCRKLMLNGTRGPRGCNKGKECERFHPKMCSSSINHAECLNVNCSLYHVKGTRRLNSAPRTQDQPNRNRNKASGRDSRHTEDPTHRESTQQHPKPVLQQDFLDLLRILKQEIVEAIRAPPHYPPLQNQLPMGSHPNPSMTHPTHPPANQHAVLVRGYPHLQY